MLNFKRNLLITAELEANGVRAVPNLYFFRLEDLDRYLVWLDDVRPGAVAVNLQTFRTEVDWGDVALPGLTYLSVGMPAGTKLVATGSSRPDRIRTLKDLFGDRLVLVSQNPLQYARHGAVMTANGRIDRHARMADLFAANVAFYASLLGSERPAGGSGVAP